MSSIAAHCPHCRTLLTVPTTQKPEQAITCASCKKPFRVTFPAAIPVVASAPVVGPPLEADLATFRLEPGERRTVRVQTLPVGGSSYPARLILRPAAPLRAAQAVSDPK